jgi:outer membrane protein with glycine zipper
MARVRAGRRVVAVGMVALLLAGCAAARPTPQATATAGGVAAGAAAGALIGQLIGGKAGPGAAIGGVLGGLIGVVIGSHQQAEQEASAPAESPPSAPAGSPQSKPAGSPPGVPAGSPPGVPRPGSGDPASASPAGDPRGDPRKGELINATAWLVRVWVDPENPAVPESKAAILLQPRAKAPHSLDVGTYRVVATAHAPTQAGERLVGRFDRTIEVEARRPGWFLKFSDAEFR